MRILKTVLIFFGCGLGAGCLFTWLINTPRLTSFWFRKGDKFLIPTYRYYLGFSFLLLVGLAAAYVISLTRGWIERPQPRSTFRQWIAAIMVLVSAPGIFAILTTGREFFESPAWLLVAVIAFLLLISVTCWVLTSKLYYQGVLINLSALPSALALLYLLVKTLNSSGELSEIVSYPIYDSLLAAACGFWIARNNPPQIR